MIAVNSGHIYYDLMIPNEYYYRVRIVEEWGEGITPKVHIVMSIFVLPFYRSELFKEEWGLC